MSVSGNPGDIDAMNSMRRKKPRVSRKGRKNLTFRDKVELIATIEKNLSGLHDHDWQTVSELFNQQAEHDQRPPRSATSVRSAFNKLRSRQKPTGDDQLDELIDRANKIHTTLYRNGKAGTSSLASEEDDDEGTPTDLSGALSTSQGVSFNHTEQEHSIASQSHPISRNSPSNNRTPHPSNMLLIRNHTSQHASPDILSSSNVPQYGSAMMQRSKDFMVPIPEPQHQSTPQRNPGSTTSSHSNIFSSAAARPMSPAHLNSLGTTYSPYTVPTNNNNNNSNNGAQNSNRRTSKARTSEVQLRIHSQTGVPGTSTDILNQQTNSLQQPMYLKDNTSQSHDFEIISTLRKENDAFREECFNLRNSHLEAKTALFDLKRAHDSELTRKNAIIAERDSRIERLVHALSKNSNGSPSSEDAIRNLKQVIEDKNRKYEQVQTELDYLNSSLTFSNQTLESMKKLHEMELKKMKAANDARSKNNND